MIQGAVFLAGRVPALLAQSSGLSLRASLEIGSSFGVKCHHIGTKTEIVALWGDNFQFCSDLVRFYAEIRTHFRKNPWSLGSGACSSHQNTGSPQNLFCGVCVYPLSIYSPYRILFGCKGGMPGAVWLLCVAIQTIVNAGSRVSEPQTRCCGCCCHQE